MKITFNHQEIKKILMSKIRDSMHYEEFKHFNSEDLTLFSSKEDKNIPYPYYEIHAEIRTRASCDPNSYIR